MAKPDQMLNRLWIDRLMPTIERINAAGTPYRVQHSWSEIIVFHGEQEIGFAARSSEADYLLRGILRHIEGIEAANAKAKGAT